MSDSTKNPISLAQMLALLNTWASLQKELNVPLDIFSELTQSMPDCPLLNPIYKVWGAYTQMVSQQVGDESEWLGYYEHDCDMGTQPREVSWTNPDGTNEVVLLDSLEKLAYVLTH